MKRRVGILVMMAAALMAFAPAASAGPVTPNVNLEVILRPAASGSDNAFGLVKFRQPRDADTIVYLDVWVRDLAPNHSYFLQRATDPNVNDACTGTNWLTLGQGPVPEAFATDDRGTGRADMFRDLTAVRGQSFDIHFRVSDAETSAVVLDSACYQFTASQ